MDEQKALKWQALYDNMWLAFALGLVVPIIIYTVWGMGEILGMVPKLDVNKAMEALKPVAVQQAAPALEAPAAAAPSPAEAAPHR